MRDVVLWGHCVDEYQEMFDVPEETFHKRILEYASGPSAINAQLHEDTHHIISCDPLFTLDKATLRTKISLIFEEMLTRVQKEKFDFSRYGGFEAFIKHRQDGIEKFFADYEQGRVEKRYLPLRDNTLPFADFSFDMAVSSHYLFTDLEAQNIEFHVQAIRELALVAKEVRIFPLIDSFNQTSSLLGPVLLELQKGNYGIEVRNVMYHLQPQGNAMLRVWAQQCTV